MGRALRGPADPLTLKKLDPEGATSPHLTLRRTSPLKNFADPDQGTRKDKPSTTTHPSPGHSGIASNGPVGPASLKKPEPNPIPGPQLRDTRVSEKFSHASQEDSLAGEGTNYHVCLYPCKELTI